MSFLCIYVMNMLKEIENLYERLTDGEKELFIKIYQSVDSDKVKLNKKRVLNLLKNTIESNIKKGIQTDIDRKIKINKLNNLN